MVFDLIRHGPGSGACAVFVSQQKIKVRKPVGALPHGQGFEQARFQLTGDLEQRRPGEAQSLAKGLYAGAHCADRQALFRTQPATIERALLTGFTHYQLAVLAKVVLVQGPAKSVQWMLRVGHAAHLQPDEVIP